MKPMTVEAYRGFGIDYNVYRQGEYSVHLDGDDFWFESLDEARFFIDDVLDGIEED